MNRYLDSSENSAGQQSVLSASQAVKTLKRHAENMLESGLSTEITPRSEPASQSIRSGWSRSKLSPFPSPIRSPETGRYHPTRTWYAPGGKANTCRVVTYSPGSQPVVGRVQSTGTPSDCATIKSSSLIRCTNKRRFSAKVCCVSQTKSSPPLPSML